MSKYHLDHHGVFDAGGDSDITTALTTGLNVTFLPLPRLAGVAIERYLLLGANTP